MSQSRLRSGRPTPTALPAPNAEVAQFLDEFDAFLDAVRGLAGGTRRKYVRFVRHFLHEWISDAPLQWQHLSADALRAYACHELSSTTRRPSNAPFVALRAMLRFLAVKGLVAPALEGAVPRIRRWRHATLPACLSTDEVDRVISFAASDDTRQPLRNTAIVLLLARTGMRAAEVTKLTLDDIDWGNGVIRVRGTKSRRDRELPLARSVGRALLAYLKRERPLSPHRAMFLEAAPPWRPFADTSSISKIVRRAMSRANVSSARGAAHVLRHAAATNMLRQGASFKDIADVLGHQSLQSTTIYAKLDLPALSRWADAVYTHTATPSAYYGATISWVNNGWQLKMRDGRTMYFAECAGCTSARAAALREFDDRLGNKLTLSRDSYGNLTQVTGPDGRYISLTYDGSNRVTQAQDNIGRIVTYQYDSGGRLAQVTNPDGGVESYTYDSANNMLSVTKPGGQTMVTNQYDTNNRVVKQTLADGSIYQFAYTLGGSNNVTQTAITDPNGNVRQVNFNSASYATSITWATGKPEAQSFSYTRGAGTNLLTASTDALGRTTNYTYDSMGNLTSATALSGTSQAVTANYTYEPVYSRLTTYADGLGHTDVYHYDSSGNRIEMDDALGDASHFAYNGLGQMTSATDPMGNATTFSYQDGDVVSITDPLGRTVTRLTDGIGRLMSVSDPLGNTTRVDYNGRSLPTRVTDARGGVTSIAYDANSNLTSFTDANGGVTGFTYDAKDRPASRTDPLQATESYTYDGNDNLTQFTDRTGKVSTFGYDGLNRLISAAYGQTQSGGTLSAPDATVSTTYDAGSRPTQIVDSQGGTITGTYDGLDRLTAETTPQGSVSYAYDAANRRTSFQVAGQSGVTYAYDNADRLTTITQGSVQVGFAYDADSRRSTLTLPNGIVATYSYDTASQLTGISYANGGTTLGNLTYAYDNAGRRTQIGGSLAAMTLPAALTSATYDVGNRLTNWAGTMLTYDANGNLTADGSLGYGWDSRNRLISLTGAATASFVYDALGRRTGKTINGTTTNFLYDGASVVQELAGGTPSANLLTGLGIDEVFSRTDGLGTRSFVTDDLGSTVALTDGSGAVKTSYAYEPYGNTTTSGEVSGNASQYTGLENDGTGLYYYRARYYHPGFSRFVAEDPIGLAGGSNLYAYVQGNPASYIDPLGLQAWRPGMTPPSNIPGGPWTPAGPGQRPGSFYGPKQPAGAREMCTYVPDKANGGPSNAEKGYWKTKMPGEDWYRYDLNGNPQTADEAHPSPNSESSPVSIPQLTPWGIGIFLGTYSSPAY